MQSKLCSVPNHSSTSWLLWGLGHKMEQSSCACAVCAQYRADAIDFDPRLHSDVFIIWKCCSIVVYVVLSRESTYDMLSRAGIVRENEKPTMLNQNLLSLSSSSVPKECFPLRARERSLLWWIAWVFPWSDMAELEEKICANYCTTMHVTCLFQLSRYFMEIHVHMIWM